MKRASSTLYLTLIDFLIQILFLGLLLGYVHATKKTNQAEEVTALQNKLKAAIEEIKKKDEVISKLLRTSGHSTIQQLTDFLTRLGPLVSQAEKVGGVHKAVEVLVDHQNKGQGKPSCLPDAAMLTIIHAFEDHLEIREISPELQKLLAKLGVSGESIGHMSFVQFENKFSPVLRLEPGCRYNVTVLEYSPYKMPRDVVRKVFVAFPKDAKK